MSFAAPKGVIVEGLLQDCRPEIAQRGWITKQERKKKGSVWVYHWYVLKPETGRKAEHACVIGAVADFPSEKDAWREIDRRHLKPQLDQKAIAAGRLTFGDLAVSYKENGMKKLAVTTQYTVKHCIDDYLLLRWETSCALDIQPLEIEQWLGSLKRSNPTKDKIRRIMFVIYTRAQKYALVPRNDSSNPVRWVEQSAKSSYKPVACLRGWQRETMYGRPNDWLFASTRNKGRKPRSSSVLTFDHLRPAAIAAGVKLKNGQLFGFHNFRHGLASWLVNQGTDVKTVQGLLRHSNVSTTTGLNAHRVNSSMLAAQDSVMRAIQSGTQTIQ